MENLFVNKIIKLSNKLPYNIKVTENNSRFKICCKVKYVFTVSSLTVPFLLFCYYLLRMVFFLFNLINFVFINFSMNV